MDKIKIAVCGPLELDCPLGIPEESLCREARADGRRIFSELIELTRRQSVDICLFCGPLFDHRRLSERNARMICDAFDSVRSCRFVLFPDDQALAYPKSLYSTNRFSENVYIAGVDGRSCFEFYDIGTAVICDRGNPSAVRLDHNKINILMTRGEPSPDSPVVGLCDLVTLADRADPGQTKIAATLAIRPGALMHTGFGSPVAREGGVYLAEAEKKGTLLKLDCQRMPLRSNIYASLEVDVNGCATEEEALERAKAELAVADLPSGCVLELTLVGATAEALEFRGRYELPGVRSVIIDNLTLPVADEQHLAKDMTAKGMIYRSFLPLMKGSEETAIAADAFRAGVAALSYNGRGSK